MIKDKLGWCIVDKVNQDPIGLDAFGVYTPYDPRLIEVWENLEDGKKVLRRVNFAQHDNYELKRIAIKVELLSL